MQEERAAQNRRITLIVGSLFLALFFLVWLLVAYSVGTVSLDSHLEVFINSHQYGGLTALMVGASLYGREYFWIPVVALMLVFGGRDTKILAFELAILFVVGIAAGEVLKEVYFRERPFIALGSAIVVPPGIPLDTDSSFPSGHAIVVSIGGSFVLWKMFFSLSSSSRRAKIASLLLVLEAAVVCYSRVYIGVHYPLDVVAGIFLACAIVLLVGFVLGAYFARWLIRLADLAHRLTSNLLHIPEVI